MKEIYFAQARKRECHTLPGKVSDSSSYKKIDAVLLLFDIADGNSFDDVANIWLDQVLSRGSEN